MILFYSFPIVIIINVYFGLGYLDSDLIYLKEQSELGWRYDGNTLTNICS